MQKLSTLEQEALSNVFSMGATDHLTGWADRHTLEKVLQREYGCASRARSPLAIITVAIDGWNLYANTYGRLAGEQSLKDVAAVLRNAAKRPSDLAARYAAGDLMLILPDTDFDGAVAMAQTMRRDVENLRAPHDPGAQLPYATISLGVVVVVPPVAQSWDQIMEQALLALQTAKDAGPNHMVAEIVLTPPTD